MRIDPPAALACLARGLGRLALICAVAMMALPVGPAAAQDATGDQRALTAPISLRDTFPVGTNGLCEAQIVAPEPGAGLFDRRYSIICRDAAAPVGTLWVVRGRFSGEAQARFGAGEGGCSATVGEGLPEAVAGRLANGRALRCDGAVATQLLVGEAGGRTYAARGLAVYDKALELGLASLVEDSPVPGEVDIPLTQTTDSLAFARQQAEAISSDQALIEAYRRSNAGEFAEAAEFFAASARALSGKSELEAQLNRALLQSNLGNYVEAARLFAQTQAGAAADPILARLLRNYEAIDALNQGKPEAALAAIIRPIESEFVDLRALSALEIGPALAQRLVAEHDRRANSGVIMSLTPLERAQLLDGQADYLRAAALRRNGAVEAANAALLRANTALAEVREGRVLSIIWLRAQILSELAEVAERTGRPADAEVLHQQGIGLLAAHYPDSPAYDSARAQLAGFYARSGRSAEAADVYRAIVSGAQDRALPSLRGLMLPYFGLLLADGSPAAVADLFAASQLLQRPGLAQTQAVLARELSGGDDAAALLFRKTTNLARSIEQMRGEIAQMNTIVTLTDELAKVKAEREAKLAQLQAQQAELLGQLAEYPRYRAVSNGGMDLAELQAILRADEAYVKLVTLGDQSFVLYATPGEARAYEAAASPVELEGLVKRIRDSIALAEDGEILTFPFDIAGARELYLKLFGPIADRLPRHRHIIFEPDGAMLKLPINLLVTDDESVVRYQQRVAVAESDEYDFSGTAWLGRGSQISTSVSPAAFRDVRRSRPSKGANAYLGLGQNAPVGTEVYERSRTRSAVQGGTQCQWAPSLWGNPIQADELFDTAGRLGGGSTVVIEEAFTDTAISARKDLVDYRILHFATHGLVTAPQPDCPPRPALLTSFGDGDSDGLLTFAEIFGLRIDADLVILSACDTAGEATVGVTREAGVTSGGDFALDGLVRAFVGAGGRTVLASHWPVPDDFDATKRLIGGLFAAGGAGAGGLGGADPGVNQTAGALRQSQLALMDEAQTSHPFYWSAFAVVGDGSIELVR